VLTVYRFIVVRLAARSNSSNSLFISLILLGMLVGMVYIAKKLGVHFAVASFFAGLVIPSTAIVAHRSAALLHPVAMLFFLPIYFVGSSLNYSFAGLAQWEFYQLAGPLVFLATATKILAAYISCRIAPNAEVSFYPIGVLLNARGLIELFVIQIGFRVGIVSENFFLAMTIVAILTTLSTPFWYRWLMRHRS
ncbi:MAG: cation:proton antiporter, partial [Gemmataceae bacterium]